MEEIGRNIHQISPVPRQQPKIRRWTTPARSCSNAPASSEAQPDFRLTPDPIAPDRGSATMVALLFHASNTCWRGPDLPLNRWRIPRLSWPDPRPGRVVSYRPASPISRSLPGRHAAGGKSVAGDRQDTALASRAGRRGTLSSPKGLGGV